MIKNLLIPEIFDERRMLMKTIDHKILADYLMDSMVDSEIIRHKKAFILGCILPDYIPFTYMRGYTKSKEFKGHNTESSKKYIEKRMKKLVNRKMTTSADFLGFGMLIHYIADSFTYPHNETFYGNVRDHINYETELHKTFNMILMRNQEVKHEPIITELFEYLNKQHSSYDLSEQNFLNDCNFILNVCLNVFHTLLHGEEYRNLYNEKVSTALLTSS
jgi:hypothetical protein